MSNEAFARLKVDVLLAAQGWALVNASVFRFVVMNSEAEVGYRAGETVD
jgi:hypothetical protein